MSVAILVPVLGRPQNTRPLLASIWAATTIPTRVLFLTSPEDQPQRHAVIAETRRAGNRWVAMLDVDGGYAAKINAGVAHTDEPYVFIGADDLRFERRWFEEAQKLLTDQVQAVGVNDLLPRARIHATHFLMTRQYAELPTLDGRRGPLCEAYDHSFCDDELIATAMSRGAYTYASKSRVRHLHPDGGTAEWDPTYAKGRARMRLDGKLFRQRSRLWT